MADPAAPAVDYPANAYCVVSQVLTAYEGGFSPAANWTANGNLELQRAILDATQQIEQVTHRYFGRRTDSLELSGDGSQRLWLSKVTSVPALSVSQVQYRSDFVKTYDWNAQSVTLAESDYDLADDGLSLVRLASLTSNARRVDVPYGTWQPGWKNYRVTGVFGVAEVPMVVEAACILMVREKARPGYIKAHEGFLRERFQDGYEYERPGRFDAVTPSYTGIVLIDRMLAALVDEDPSSGFTVV